VFKTDLEIWKCYNFRKAKSLENEKAQLVDCRVLPAGVQTLEGSITMSKATRKIKMILFCDQYYKFRIGNSPFNSNFSAKNYELNLIEEFRK